MAAPPIPKLPGYTVCLPQSLSDKGFKKNQTLSYVNGYQREEAVATVKDLPERIAQATDGVYATGSPATLSPSMLADTASKLPQWVENDRKVLRFYGYFKESVVESNMENHRIRKVILYYYLEDDSMHVAEPRQDNSGIPQGVFIKRHRVTREGGGFFNPTDFGVGETVTIYGRTFYLVDADTYTREFLAEKLGKEQVAPLPYPGDPVDAYRTAFGINRGRAGEENVGTLTRRMNDFKAYVEARLGKPSHLLDGDRLRQFLENNKKVLRFWCVWDERNSMYGDRRPYVLHYFLEDDTVEILEINESNSGRDPFPVFLKRGPLPKVSVKTNTTLNPRLRKDQCYSPGDFRLGSYINVLARDFYLHDADTFTKAWYMDNLGYTVEELTPVDIKEAIVAKPRAALPAYNGYGTLEDSLQNCLSLVPKPPKRDLHKLMNKDKIILRFVVRMVDTDTHKHSATDLARRFILSYFMMDDSLLVFEPPTRNSGISGGKFLERQRIYKPRSEETYTYLDLYVGTNVEVFNRSFELMEADEYTLTYMENYKDIFVMADTDVLIRSLKAQSSGKEDAARAALIAADRAGTGSLNGEELEAGLKAAGFKFTRHQAISLKRRLDQNKTGTISIEEFIGLLGL
ncbi:EF-hand domain-containing family member C2 [Tetrabaena socialis]|uniref:EF-hand domain-containing family member C2 n=1 Tax=Tetrabaena socialis TaxID=47790 RepID=A0A2J7ZSR3_9CHLO|nr:EF-hand domain-containing family member C2 [Tetrabaena socialis]|eukprot:PNH03302.1 EF-hand domain-containing family member C2 [Tetrabaena socialis]